MKKSLWSKVTGTVIGLLPLYLFTFSLLLSCSEEDNDEVEEYPEWQLKNDSYFSQLVQDTKTKGDRRLIVAYSKPDQDYTYVYSDYIVVEELERGTETTSPLHTDSVEVHYVGHLLPSTTYANGYEFDRSFSGEFDPVVATPAKLYVGGTVVGFSTALQHMHRGDHWRVYIPYQLGYSTATGSVPQYSTLIFDLRLVDYWGKAESEE